MKYFILSITATILIFTAYDSSAFWPFKKKNKFQKQQDKANVKIEKDAKKYHKKSKEKLKKLKNKKDEYPVTIEKLTRDAEKGLSTAQNTLGKMYLEGVESLDIKPNFELAKKYLKMGAENGNVLAMFNYGLCLELINNNSEIGKKDSEDLTPEEIKILRKKVDEALKWYTKAADKGLKSALINAAKLYEERKNYLKAAQYYYMLYEDYNYDPAMYRLGQMYMTGIGTDKMRIDKDLQSAKYYFEEAAKLGNASAHLKLADFYAQGIACERDYNKMRNHLWLATQDGNAEAQTKMGYCYLTGMGVSKDPSTAVKYFKSSAMAGDVIAQSMLGNCYLTGMGVAMNYKEAVKWYKLAAIQKDPIAELNLGVIYILGLGVEVDYQYARERFEVCAKAAKDKSIQAKAIYYLGTIYEKAKGVKKDLEKAYKLYSQATCLGNADSKVALARFYMQGIVIKKDLDFAQNHLIIALKDGAEKAPEEIYNLAKLYQKNDKKTAFTLYELAANKKHVKSIVAVAYCYLQGNGTIQSKEMAKIFFKEAAKYGSEEAYVALKKYF